MRFALEMVAALMFMAAIFVQNADPQDTKTSYWWAVLWGIIVAVSFYRLVKS